MSQQVPSPLSSTPPPYPPLQPDVASPSSPSPSLHPPLPTTTDTTQPPSHPPSPPQFTPFFTLLTTSSPATGVSSTHHPTVTYTFASDPPDTSPITAAALHSLSSSSSSSSPSPSSSSPQSTTPRSIIEREERYILLDLDATGTKIISAQSMSPAWAVVGTEVGVAPHWEGEGAAAGAGAAGKKGRERGEGLMLRIEGVEAPTKKAGGTEEDDKRGLEQLMEEYENGMRELRRVVEANDGESDTAGEELLEEREGRKSIGVPA